MTPFVAFNTPVSRTAETGTCTINVSVQQAKLL